MCIGYRWESYKERAHYENQAVGGLIIFKWILEREKNGVVWTGMICLKIGTSGELL
jgi:hypothetical protein